ncbi:hypothetical protein [Frankia sp. Cr2]|uniref:hypothetical protein n=1 Tax=Frankia sp. Cr2 TaxID=3073932 RepID=UPI002AD4E6FC|nr:hypothetical protein [Frankia sp. Cr2]
MSVFVINPTVTVPPNAALEAALEPALEELAAGVPVSLDELPHAERTSAAKAGTAAIRTPRCHQPAAARPRRDRSAQPRPASLIPARAPTRHGGSCAAAM